MWEKLKEWCHHSVTIAWAYAKFAVGAAIAALPVIAGLVADPDVKAQVMQWVPAQHDGIVLMVIAVITYLARMRTAGD